MVQFRAQKVAGFSMIEVLIAVLILAIGLLGVAALQMASMNSGQESYFRTQATAIAEDYASRIKANRQTMVKLRNGTGELHWDVDGPLVTAQTYMSQFVADPLVCANEPVFCRPDEDAGDGEVCSAADMIAFEQWDVCTQTAALLPGGTVHVSQAANSLRLSIAVAWTATEAREDTGEEAVAINPVCAQFNIDAGKDCVVVEAIP